MARDKGEDEKSKLLARYSESIATEMRGCFDYFWKTSPTDSGSPAYGFALNASYDSGKTCVGATGFGLAAIAIGVEEGYITREQGHERVLGTLRSILALQDDPRSAWEGFLYRFIRAETGFRSGTCEAGSVDMAMLVCGVLAAGEYFGGEIKTLANEIYAKINWNAWVVNRDGKKFISLGYTPEKGLSFYDWGALSEQIMVYVLGAGSPTEEYRLEKRLYTDFTKPLGEYKGNWFYYSYYGCLFTYQYSHAFIDFRNYDDEMGINWFDNSVKASEAAYQYCVDNKNMFKTYSEVSWGLTSCNVPGKNPAYPGYHGPLGFPPRSLLEPLDLPVYATIAPCGAIGSTPFTPEKSLKALEHYLSIPELQTEYGVGDAYDLEKEWYDTTNLGIDKGISIIMLANFKNDAVWKMFMKNENILTGLSNIGFTKKQK
jgi:hypothetical protein